MNFCLSDSYYELYVYAMPKEIKNGLKKTILC